MKNTFRKIVFLVLAIYIVYIGIPYLWPYLYGQATLDALTWIGYGGAIDVYGPIPYILSALNLVSMIGLLYFKVWARNLFFTCSLISLAIGPFSGLVILGPLEFIPAGIVSMGMGAILAMSFLSSVKDEFQPNT